MLKKISAELAPREIADLLERHLGPAPLTSHCVEARSRLRRIRDPQLRAAICVADKLVGEEDPCAAVLSAMATLREWNNRNA